MEIQTLTPSQFLSHPRHRRHISNPKRVYYYLRYHIVISTGLSQQARQNNTASKSSDLRAHFRAYLNHLPPSFYTLLLSSSSSLKSLGLKPWMTRTTDKDRHVAGILHKPATGSSEVADMHTYITIPAPLSNSPLQTSPRSFFKISKVYQTQIEGANTYYILLLATQSNT